MGRRRPRVRNTKRAGAFAGAMSSGRTLSWESLASEYVFNTAAVELPNIDSTAGGIDVRFATLIPINVTRGALTLTRIVGEISIFFNQVDMNATGGQASACLPMNIQLVPARNGVLEVGSVLDPRNSADLESNRIIWRRAYYPHGNNPTGISFNAVRGYLSQSPNPIDIKSQRRFDRANWALVLAASFPTADFFNLRVNLDLRGLFKAPDGV